MMCDTAGTAIVAITFDRSRCITSVELMETDLILGIGAGLFVGYMISVALNVSCHQEYEQT
jgi:hypothetical protein